MAAADLNMMMNVQTNSSNLRNVNKSIEKGVGPVSITFDTNGTKKAHAQIDALAKAQEKAKKEAVGFAEVVTLKGQSFAAYSIASTAIIKLTGAMSNAVREGLKLEAELAKIAQVTNTSVSSIRANTQAVLDISKNYGVASNKIAELIRLLTQTGLSFREAAKGAETLARTSLLASFDNLKDTTEGLIALMNSFELSTEQAAHGLEVVNVLAKRFAVESGDIVEAIKRSGGAFKAAGGTLEELASIFTAVRSTSRESAETIATAFRTIFGRLQRPKTIEFFKELNIELADMEGNFVGPKNAIFAISDGLEKLGIRAGSIRFAEVAEQIGGIRQLSKVVPLLTQTAKARRALAVANNAEAESDKDVGKAKQTLSQQLAELTQNFRSLITEAMDSTTFKAIAKLFLTIANTAVAIGRALKPLIPIIATIAGVKISKSFLNAVKFIRGGGASGKSIASDTSGFGEGFARGGIVPGSGNGDTVPAMLTPGEFVVKKSAVQAYGAANLGKINKYANGGVVPDASGYVKADKRGLPQQRIQFSDADKDDTLSKSAKGTIKGIFLERLLRNRIGRDSATDDHPDFPSLTNNEKEILNVSRKNAEVKLKKSGGKPDTNTTIIYGFNKGGAVGTDTVPALLTPGEFVVNQKSAKAYGYGNLGEINKYAKGGVVQRFEDGGGVGKPKFRNIEGGFGQLLQEMKEGEKVLDSTFAAFGDWDKALQESEGNLKYNPPGRQDQSLVGIPTDPSFKQSTVDKSIANKRARERQQGFASAKRSTKGSGMDMAALGAFSKQSEQKRVKAGAISSRAASADKAIAQIPIFGKLLSRINKGGKGAGSALKNLTGGAKGAAKSLIEVPASAAMASVAFQGVAEAAKQFGLEMANAPAFQEGANRATTISSYGEIGGSAVKKSGKQILKWGNALKRSGGKLAKFGKPLAKLGATAAKVGPKIAKIANVVGWVDLAGAALEGLFTTNYKKLAEDFQGMGNEALAGEAALKAYAQQQNRSIPILGSFMNLFGSGQGQSVDQLDERGKGVVETVKLRTAIIALKKSNEMLDTTVQEQTRAALESGDFSEVGKTIQDGFFKTAGDLGARADKQIERGTEIANLSGSAIVAKEALKQGAVGAAAAGTAGAVTTAGLGAAPAAAIGGLIGLGTGSITGYLNAGSMRKEGKEMKASGLEAQQMAIEQMLEGFKAAGPTIDFMTQQTARAGGSFEDLAAKLKDAGFEAGDYGLILDEVGFQENEKAIKRFDAEIAEQQKLFEKGNANQKEDIKGTIKSLETKKKGAIARKKEYKDRENTLRLMAIQEKRQRLANAALREQAEALKKVSHEIFNFNEKMRGLEDTASMAEFAKTGQLNAGAVSQMTGNRDLQGSLSDISKRGKLDELVDRSSVLGSEAQKRTSQVVQLQRGSEAFFDQTSSEDFASMDEESAKTKAKEIVEKMFGGNIPSEMKATAEQMVNDMKGAIQEGNLGKLKGIVDRNLQGAAKKTIDAVQNALSQQDQKITQYNKMLNELSDMQINSAKARNDRERQYNQSLAALDAERVQALEGIGLSKPESLSRRKTNIETERGRINALESAGRARINKAGGGDARQGGVASGMAESSADELTQRKKNIATMEFENQIAQDKMSLIRKEIGVMQEEEQARRENIKAMQSARGALAEELAFGTDEARASLLDDANVAATALSQGSMAGFTGEQRGQVDSFLGRFTGLGGGPNGIGAQAREAKAQLGAQELLEQGLIRPDQFEQTKKDIIDAEIPMDKKVAAAIDSKFDELEALEKNSYNNQNKIAEINKQNTIEFGKYVAQFGKQLDEAFVRDFDKLITDAEKDRGDIQAKREAKNSEKEQLDLKIAKKEEEFETWNKSGPKGKTTTGDRTREWEKRKAEIAELRAEAKQIKGDEKALGVSAGRAEDRQGMAQRGKEEAKETLATNNANRAALLAQNPASAKTDDNPLGLSREKREAIAQIDQIDWNIWNDPEFGKPQTPTRPVGQAAATPVGQTAVLPQGRPASVAPTLTKAQRNLQRMTETGTAGQKRFAQRKLEEQKAVVDVNIAPQQVQINIPEIQNIVADVMQKTALKEVAKAFSNYVANLQGSDGSPEATAEAADKCGQSRWRFFRS